MAGKSETSPAVPIGPQLKEIVNLAYRARRPVLLEGATGIGKSEVLAEVARDLGIRSVVLDLSLLEPPDLVGLPIFENGRTSYAVPEILPVDGSGLLILEELNRAERYIQQPALQLLTARRLHNYELPEGWSCCAAINPEQGEYQVTPMDPALRSRFLNLRVKADLKCWLRWAKQNDLHPAVIRVAESDQSLLDVTPPRTWKYVSDLLQKLTPEEHEKTAFLRGALGGYLKRSWVTRLLAELRDMSVQLGVDVEELLASYHQNQTLRRAFKGLLTKGQTDSVNQITRRVVSILNGPEFDRLLSEDRFSLKSFERFLADLPGDQRELLQVTFAEVPKGGELIDVTPKQLLEKYRNGTPLYRKVNGWIEKPECHHRVQCLIQQLNDFLEEPSELQRVRRSNSDRANLGTFLVSLKAAGGTVEQVSRPLQKLCEDHELDPVKSR